MYIIITGTRHLSEHCFQTLAKKLHVRSLINYTLHLKARDHLEELGIRVRLTLRSSGELLWRRCWTFGFHKRCEISRVL